MKKIIFSILILSQFAVAQISLNRYEVEILMNPNADGKDTRQVNAVLIFEKDSLKIISRRKKDLVYKDFKFTDIKIVEHSFSKSPTFGNSTRSALLTVMTGLPVYFGVKEKHWLNLVTNDNFAVLKIENDNFRLIKNELLIRNFDVININEDKQ